MHMNCNFLEADDLLICVSGLYIPYVLKSNGPVIHKSSLENRVQEDLVEKETQPQNTSISTRDQLHQLALALASTSISKYFTKNNPSRSV